MSKINLYSSDWCELIFEGRNKKYGAYDMRSQTENRHRYAILLVAGIFAGLVTIPALIKTILPEKKEQFTEVTTLANINIEQVEKKKKERTLDIPRPTQPIPQLKEVIKNVAPIVVEDEKVPPEEEGLKSQDELLASAATISIATIAGTDDGVFIDELDEVQRQNVGVEEPPLMLVEEMPQFPGGPTKMYEFLKKNLRYPELASDNNIQGTVTLTFVVGVDGAITNIQVARSLDPDCDAEAIRVVKMMPKWSPGKQGGKTVRVQYVLPVKFTITR